MNAKYPHDLSIFPRTVLESELNALRLDDRWSDEDCEYADRLETEISRRIEDECKNNQREEL
jgi:hypothetical protein